jgi:hypothetical protein
MTICVKINVDWLLEMVKSVEMDIASASTEDNNSKLYETTMLKR